MNNLILRPIEDSDIPLIAQWLNKPHIKKWYEPIDEWLDEIGERQGEFSWLHHVVAMVGDTPIGFGQYYDCFDSVGLEDWNERAFPKRGEIYSIDYLIGEENYLGLGYGKELVKQLTELALSLGAREIIVDPDKANAKSNGVLKVNGYAYDEAVGYYRFSHADRF
jgi:RimJ/RimL family protein N-acetyltransferase